MNKIVTSTSGNVGKSIDRLDVLQPWERKFGETTEERTKNLGHDSSEYRSSVHFPPPDKEWKLRHEVYIHHLGSEVLRAMFTDEQLYERERTIALKKQSKIGQLLRKRIKVTDFDDGGLNISMEQDWDTSSWNDTLIEAAAEALLYVFYDLNEVSSIDKKERAIQMLKKLMDRHIVAVEYIRKNLEMLMGKAASKLIRRGVSGGILNLLYVINSCKEKFAVELSNYSFAGRIVEMLILEARLAAVLIQHTYRARFSKQKLKQQSLKSHPHLVGFGTEREVYYQQLRVINARSSELRYYWRLMHHHHHPTNTRQQTGGLRGPIHVGPNYLILSLDILRYLVSDAVKGFAQSNREDVVRANGCILLSSYVGTLNNKFAAYAVQVLAEIAKVAESFYPVIESGCIASVIKYTRYMRTVLGVGAKVVKPKKQDHMSPAIAYLSSLDIIANAALHASAVFRARDGYQCIRSAAKGIERTDYREVLSTMQIKNGVRIEDLTPLLCSALVLTELGTIILTSSQSSVVSKAIYCYLAILSSDGHDRAIGEIMAGGGKLLIKLIQFLTHDDDSVATMVLCIFQQMTCYESSRHALSLVNIPGQLIRLYQQVTNPPSKDSNKSSKSSSSSSGSSGSNVHQKKLYRLLLATVFLARQKNWKLYDPELLFEELFQTEVHPMKEILYIYLLRIIKDQCFLGHNEKAVRSDLLLLPTYAFLSRAMCKVLINYPFHYFIDSLYHPNDPLYYESCPLDETCCVSALIQSTIFYKPLLTRLFSPSIILYFSKFLFLCKYLFLGKTMTNRQLVLLFQGIKSAIIFLSEMIPAILTDGQAVVSMLAVMQETELIEQSIYFFLNTLQEFQIQKKLQEEEMPSEERQAQLYYTLQLQKEIGVCCIKFLTNYAKIVNYWHQETLPIRHLSSSVPVTVSIQHLYPSGIRIAKTLKNLKRLYQHEIDKAIPAPSFLQSSSSLQDQFHYHNMSGTLTSFYSNRNITFQFNSYRDEMTFIQDCLCSALAEMTRTKGGAVAALQEWDIQNALRYHLPPPLSGLVFSNKSNQIPDPTQLHGNSQIVVSEDSRAHTSANIGGSVNNRKVTISVDGDQHLIDPSATTAASKGLTVNTNLTPSSRMDSHNAIQSPHHKHSTGHQQKKIVTEVLLKDESYSNYRLELMEMPSSFFDLLAHLCHIDEGKIFCFADGFLRRALDKLTLIHSLLPTNQTNEVVIFYQSYQQLSRQKTKRLLSSSASNSFLLSSVTSPQHKDGRRSPFLRPTDEPNQEERAMQRAQKILSEGKDDDDDYQHILEFSKHFRSSFDEHDLPRTSSNPRACLLSSTMTATASSLMNAQLPPEQVFNWIHKKKDLIACLKMIKFTCNFHHKHHGSTNELMLSTSLYSITSIIKDIIKLHLPRYDELILLAYECLAELAKDTFRFHQFMEENHLFDLIRQELSLSVEFPVRGIEAAVNMIRYATQGITSQYIITMIPLLREPLLRISRIYPQLNDQVRFANWMLTKSAMIYKSTIDPDYFVSNVQNITMEMEEFFRTGKREQLQEQSHPQFEEIKEEPFDKQQKAIGENKTSPATEKLPSINRHRSHSHASGDYLYCGVGSCGSLRFPDAPSSHGEYEQYSEEETKQMIQKLPLLEPSPRGSPDTNGNSKHMVMPLTKLPLRDKSQQALLQAVKAKDGFIETRKIALSPERRSASAPKALHGGSVQLVSSPSKNQLSAQSSSPIRSISVSELPQLKFTRPKRPKPSE